MEPCPFCGGGETRVDEQTYWTGMRSQVCSVNLRHWCQQVEDDFVKPVITIRARTEAQAVEAWNRRALKPDTGEKPKDNWSRNKDGAIIGGPGGGGYYDD